MSLRTRHIAIILSMLLGFSSCAVAGTTGTATISGSEQVTGGIWDFGTVTVTVNNYSESVPYGQYSTPDSLASAIAAKFSNDCNGPANARSAPGGVINFRMRHSAELNQLSVTVSSSLSFSGTPAAPMSPTTTTASIGAMVITLGQSTTVDVQVSCNQACGQVTYQIDGWPWTTSALDGSGHTSVSTPNNLTTGPHNVVAVYQGNGILAPSTSNTLSLTVNGTTPTTTTASIGATTIAPGQSTAVDVQVSCGFACGQVAYQIDGGAWTIGTLDGSGHVSAPTPTSLAAGLHNVTAAYQGNGSFTASTSNPVSFMVSASAGSPPTSVYSYSISSYEANGNISAYTDTVNGGWSNIGYDGLNRLTSATYAPSAGVSQYLCWGYDSFGNRTYQGISTSPCSGPPSNPLTYDAYNHVSSVSYDASGNVINDGVNQYLYDADGRICAIKNDNSGAQVGYIYNAEGQRVAKGTITSFSCDTSSNGFVQTAGYVLGLNGEQVSEVDGSDNWVHTNVYADGQLIATYQNDGQGIHFHLSDWLGTRRVQTDYAGNLESTYQTLPYGELIPSNQNLGATEHLFIGKEHDSKTGNDYFGARYYGSSTGRFITPDPSGLYYANYTNPQSLNLYNYALNNPMKYIDPTGLDCVYLNDAGNGLDTDKDPVDHNSNISECLGTDANGKINGSNGGYWIEGHVDASGVNVDPDTGQVSYGGAAVASWQNGSIQLSAFGQSVNVNATPSPSGSVQSASLSTYISSVTVTPSSFRDQVRATPPVQRLTTKQIYNLCAQAAVLRAGGNVPGNGSGTASSQPSIDTSRSYMQTPQGYIPMNGDAAKVESPLAFLSLAGSTGECVNAVSAVNR